jgi:hypothetical protein
MTEIGERLIAALEEVRHIIWDEYTMKCPDCGKDHDIKIARGLRQTSFCDCGYRVVFDHFRPKAAPPEWPKS